MTLCRRCNNEFDRSSPSGCRFHRDAFVCRPHPPDHYAFELNDAMYKQLLEKNWAAKFWDCCGAEDQGAPGCATANHVGWDD
ncbi:hypothetical protein H9P43_001303 [Blastocladiella emersonii ATCC 22665]|nr:hypothetical protein H9P43_001303 [Blastocladiella emersonii ATCC 22665]